MNEITQAELFEFVSQYGLTDFTPDSSSDDMIAALENEGFTQDMIDAEVEEQRQR